LALEPNDFTIHGYLAHELIAAGEEDRARPYIEQGWDLVRTGKPDSLSSALRLAAARALLQFKQGDAHGALDTATVGLAYEGFQPDLSFFAGHAHELLAHRADSPSKRSTHYDHAREAYRACLTTRGKTLAQRYVRGVSSWMSMTRLGTVQLLTGDSDAALRSFEDALNEEPSLDEASLGRAQAIVELGRGKQALEALDPFIDPSKKSSAPVADAWLIAAHAANQMGSIDDLKLFLAKARSFSQDGYRYAHHNRLHGSLHCQLLCYLGQPAGGLGTIGTAGALMSGSPPAQAWTIEAGERHTMETFVRNLLLTGNSTLVDALLRPEAEQSLPGITNLVGDVVRALGMTVEEQ
jgi:tetratricopeptide (TPR) repeat protein